MIECYCEEMALYMSLLVTSSYKEDLEQCVVQQTVFWSLQYQLCICKYIIIIMFSPRY